MNVSSIALSGLYQAQSALEGVARRVSSGSGDTAELATDAVTLSSAKNSFEANIKVLKAADEIEKSTLYLLG